jgi:hypothetical protein
LQAEGDEIKGVPIYHPDDLYKEGGQYCALETYVRGDQSHDQYEAEENAQSNGKQGANLVDEVIVLEKQACQFPDHCSQQGGDNLNWSVESPCQSTSLCAATT